MDNIKKTFSEFFAGIGLIRIGLENAGWKVCFSNDIDPVKAKLYKANYEDKQDKFCLSDIHKLSPEDIPSVTLATASFPCTDLSLAGRRVGLHGSQSSAYWGFIKILEDLDSRRPPIILIENVVGFLSSNNGSDLREALKALNDLGYFIDIFIINASHFVPQSRLRLFIVAKQRDLFPQIWRKLLLDSSENEFRPKQLIGFIKNNQELNWDLMALPKLPTRKISLSELVDDLEDDAKEWWPSNRVQNLLDQTFERHKKVINDGIKKEYYTYLTAFRRIREGKSMAEIRSDGIAGCLRTPKGGSAKQILLKVGKGKLMIRYLSPTEYAKLMGAEGFKISGSTTEALFGFGDAVCVPVITWIAQNYLNPLTEKLLVFEGSDSILKTTNPIRHVTVA